jgi:HEAT repeat protein
MSFHLHFSHSLIDWRFWATLVLALLALALLGAEPVKSDPVENLRLALKETDFERLLKDPSLRKQIKDAAGLEGQKKILKQVRDKEISECLASIQTLPDMRKALFLSEWRQGWQDQEIGADDSKKKALLAQRFMLAIQKVLKSGCPTSRLAALSMLSEWEDSGGLPGVKGMLGRNCGPDLVEMIHQAETSQLRVAAARALGRILPEPHIAVPALNNLLKSPEVKERRAAAEALGNILQEASRMVELRSYDSLEAARTDVLRAGCAVLPVVGHGLKDSDHKVRILCAEAIRQSALALPKLVPKLESIAPKADSPDFAEFLKELDNLRKNLKPFVQALSEQSLKLSMHLNDSDSATCLTFNQALEAVASCRLHLRLIGKNDAAPTEQLDCLLADALRSAPPALAKALSHQEIRIRLAALYALETLETDATPAASAVVEALKDENSFVRWGAVRTLGNMAPLEPAKAVPGLAGMVNDANRDVRGTALVALRHYGPAAKAAVPALSRTVNQGDVETRRLAIEAIAAIGPNAGEAVPVLIAALIDPQTEIRLAAAEALAQLGPAARLADKALLKSLNDPDRDVRIAAAEALLVAR